MPRLFRHAIPARLRKMNPKKTLSERILLNKLYEKELAIAAKNWKRCDALNMEIADLKIKIEEEKNDK
jgi:DNA helicase IV